MNRKQWGIALLICLALVGGVLGTCAYLTYDLDPYFHYHKPAEEVSYALNNERYQNNGILRNFDYELVITGSSMASNFKASEAEQLFGLKSIKTALQGGTLREVNDNMVTALKANPDLKVIIRPADGSQLDSEKDQLNYSLPEYLTDDNWLNDIFYLLNKDIFFGATLPVLERTRAGQAPDSFDTYGSWLQNAAFGPQYVLAQYQRPDVSQPQPLTEERRSKARENIQQNLVDIAKNHPDTTFYYFFPPYSICYFDKLCCSGDLEAQLELYKMAADMLLELDNVRLFAFFEETDLILDLNRYTDVHHYDQEANSQILRWMAEGSHELTKDSCGDYFLDIKALYEDPDKYSALFSQGGN